MKYSFEVMAVGSPIVDTLVQVDEEFVARMAGEKGGMELVAPEVINELLAQVEGPTHRAPGGSAANTIFGATQLGLSSTFLGKVGNDENAAFYQESYRAMGGDLSRFKKSELPHGHCLSLITPDGQRTMRTHLGAAMTLDPSEISVADFDKVKHVHLEGYTLFNPALLHHVVDCATLAGCRLSLDLASFEVVNACKETLQQILSERIDVVFANEDEAAAFTGLSSDYEAMALALGELCEIAVVKLGADGALVAHAGQVIKAAADAVEHVVDTTGAGDLFAAGFIYGLVKKLPLQMCASIGAYLGAEVVQVIGAEIPDDRWAEIREKVKKLGK
jgi:sugar/nucleoside kinase (ribokinase family)